MGMTITTNDSKRTVITVTNRDGSTAGTISFSKVAKKKKKRISYNFKDISSRILRAKTSGSAGKAVTKARSVVAMLQRQLKSGQYDDKALENAIIHAKRMERIAKKRMLHMEEEERAKQAAKHKSDGLSSIEENELLGIEEEEDEQEPEMSKEELEELVRELQEFLEAAQEALGDIDGLDDLAEEYMGAVPTNLDEDDLERLKRRHRANELQEIVDADMKYLKAVFDKMQKDMQGAAEGVSLQLAGNEVPVAAVAAPVMAEGQNVDISL